MAAAMEIQTTIIEQPPAFVRRVTSSGSAPQTLLRQGLFAGFSQALPPTHSDSRDIGMSKVYAKLASYLHVGDNWDGYGGEPATYASWVNALEFLHVLPVRFEAPIPMLAGDGEISLFWKDSDRYLEVSFPGDSTFHYIFNAPGEKFASADLPLNETAINASFVAHLDMV